MSRPRKYSIFNPRNRNPSQGTYAGQTQNPTAGPPTGTIPRAVPRRTIPIGSMEDRVEHPGPQPHVSIGDANQLANQLMAQRQADVLRMIQQQALQRYAWGFQTPYQGPGTRTRRFQ